MATTRASPATVVALRFDGTVLWALDQTALPWQERQLELRSAQDVAAAIRSAWSLPRPAARSSRSRRR